MSLKITSLLASLWLLTTSLSAQIMYSHEELKKKYDQETLVFQQDGVEKNGVLIPNNISIPSRKLRMEIEENGGWEANEEYRKYRKMTGLAWLATLGGFIAILLGTKYAITAATFFSTGILIYLFALLFGVYIVITILMKRAFNHLARSVWYYNRHVLLNKK